jgi:hypothetical protein
MMCSNTTEARNESSKLMVSSILWFYFFGILDSLDKLVATLGVDQKTLIWRAIEEFVARQNS